MQTQYLLPENTNPALLPLPQIIPDNISGPFAPVQTPPMHQSPYRHRTFIEANTKEVDMQHLKQDCVVPVFSKDNEVTISHPAFIETVWKAAHTYFPGENLSEPEIRVSHMIKGRVPEAIHKPVAQLMDRDKTIYYERMMFCFEIPSIYQEVSGCRLNLTIGGVRAYNQENLYSRKGVEKFKVFIGFKNMVCCNMCVSTDGYKDELKAMSTDDLFRGVMSLFQHYNPIAHIRLMGSLQNSALSEHQFAQFIGRSRLYQCLSPKQRKGVPPLLMTDTQLNLVAKAYYQDEDFGVPDGAKEISMWRVYNLLTGANKSSYIDSFLDRSLNALELSTGIRHALNKQGNYGWFIK